jgi:hypothetical protein
MRTRVIVVVSALLVAACSANLAASTAPASAPAAGPSAASATPTPTPAAPTEAPPATPTVTTEEPSAPAEAARQELKVVKSGYSKFRGKYDSDDQIGYGVLVANPNAGWIAEQVDLSIAFLDGSGGVIDTVDETFAAILPGQTVAWADTESDYSADWSNVKSMEVTLSEPDWEAAEGSYGAYSFSKVAMHRDTLGDIDVTGRLKSTFAKELENPEIVAVFYRGGKIVAGGWTFLEHARDGAAVKVSTSYSGKTDKVELYGDLSNLSLIGG